MENNLSNFTLSKGSGSQNWKLEGVDSKVVTLSEVLSEGINSGFLDSATNWVAVNNLTNSGITAEEANKTLDELGFKDGDTIRFISKGTAAATNGMIISGGNTPETALAESQQMLRNVGFMNEKDINFLAPKMTVLDKFTQRRICRDTNKRVCEVRANHHISVITKASENILSKMDIYNEISKAWLRFAGNACLAVKQAELTSEVVKWIRQRCEATIIEMQDQYLKCVMEIQRLNKCMESISVDWLKKMYEDNLRASAESLFRNQQLAVAEVESILQRYGVMTPNRQLN